MQASLQPSTACNRVLAVAGIATHARLALLQALATS